MKSVLLNITILSLLFVRVSYSQFFADSVTPSYIAEFMKIADDFAKENNPEKGKRKFFTDTEIEHLAKLYLKCYDVDPVGFLRFMENKQKEWEKAPMDVITGKIKTQPWIEGALKAGFFNPLNRIFSDDSHALINASSQ